MDYSAANVALWGPLLQVCLIAVLVIISNILRLKIPFIRKTLMPTAVLAGFLLLGIKYTGFIKINTALLEMICYHALAIGFIALSLKANKKEEEEKTNFTVSVKSGALIVSTYLIQAIVGLIISLLIAYTIKPEFFKAAGLLLPMGYGQGPGQASNIGTTYEKLGFTGGHSFGVAIAAAGFLVACIVGVIYLNVGQKQGRFVRIQHDEMRGSIAIEAFQDENEAPVSQSIDRLSIQIALILMVYFITFGVTYLVTWLLEKYVPGVAKLLNSMLWGFNFIFGSLFAVLIRTLFSKMRKINFMSKQYQNNYLLSRISGLAFDVMIICGIATIDFEDLKGTWFPFILMIILGGVATFFHLKIMCKHVYKGYEEEGFISMFGMLTGTISSGVLLLREIDPEFKTSAATNLVTGSSAGIAFGAPVLLFVGMAAKSTVMTFAIFGIAIIYFALLVFIAVCKKKK